MDRKTYVVEVHRAASKRQVVSVLSKVDPDSAISSLDTPTPVFVMETTEDAAYSLLDHPEVKQIFEIEDSQDYPDDDSTDWN